MTLQGSSKRSVLSHAVWSTLRQFWLLPAAFGVILPDGPEPSRCGGVGHKYEPQHAVLTLFCRTLRFQEFPFDV